MDEKIKHVLLFGGFQSGKTALTLLYLTICCILVPNTNQIVCRLRFKEVLGPMQVTFWTMIEKAFGLAMCSERTNKGFVHMKKSSPCCATFFNNSKIWFLGLDDKDSTNHFESSTIGYTVSNILFDEATQIPFTPYGKLAYRLTDKRANLRKAVSTMNPGGKSHWAYDMMFRHVQPVDKHPIEFDDQYVMQMNPIDNKENLPDDVISSYLKNNTKANIMRFIDGEFCDDDFSNSVYANELKVAYGEGRVAPDVEPDEMLPIKAIGDIGFHDSNAFWFVQYDNDRILLLDYLELRNCSIIDMMKMIMQRPYKIKECIIPFDGDNKSVVNGLSPLEMAQRFMEVVKEQAPNKFFEVNSLGSLGYQKETVHDGVMNLRLLFSQFWINSEKCEAGLASLKAYQYKINEYTGEQAALPGPKWASHAADALRYVARCYTPPEEPEYMKEPWRKEGKYYAADLMKAGGEAHRRKIYYEDY